MGIVVQFCFGFLDNSGVVYLHPLKRRQVVIKCPPVVEINVVSAHGNEHSIRVDVQRTPLFWGKFLTKNCYTCPYFVTKKELTKAICKVSKGNSDFLSKASEATHSVLGLCTKGKFCKTLCDRPKGLRKCEFAEEV